MPIETRADVSKLEKQHHLTLYYPNNNQYKEKGQPNRVVIVYGRTIDDIDPKDFGTENGWKVARPWHVRPNGQDLQGWAYGPGYHDFTSKNWTDVRGSSDVRRREWTRVFTAAKSIHDIDSQSNLMKVCNAYMYIYMCVCVHLYHC